MGSASCCSPSPCFGLRATITSPLPWKWLGISAVFLGLSAWTGLFTLAGGYRGEPGRAAHRSLRCGVCLPRRVRAHLLGRGRRQARRAAGSSSCCSPWPRWAASPVLRGLDATAGYFLGLPGGLWAAAGLWRYQRDGRQARPPAAPGGRGHGPLRRGRVHRDRSGLRCRRPPGSTRGPSSAPSASLSSFSAWLSPCPSSWVWGCTIERCCGRSIPGSWTAAAPSTRSPCWCLWS